MGSDSIFSNDLGRKKRTNRLPKLKQSKLDVRREQWLSQVKNKVCKADSIGRGGSPPSSLLITDERNISSESSEDMEESLVSSPVVSSMGQSTLRKYLTGSSCSSASSRCYSGNVSEAEEDDGCLDDWEAVADALTATERQHDPNIEPPAESERKTRLDDCEPPKKNSGVSLLESGSKGMVSGAEANCRAWRPDDAFRPHSLPNLLKQHSVNINSSCAPITWSWQSIMTRPSSCPICYEDLDLTDSSFLPCPCGFHLCLFCHKRILEADGRCPGCRKQYDPIKGDVGFNGGGSSFQMCRSFSMSTRS